MHIHILRKQTQELGYHITKDADGLIHSSTFNYSIISSKPVTVDEF